MSCQCSPLISPVTRDRQEESIATRKAGCPDLQHYRGSPTCTTLTSRRQHCGKLLSKLRKKLLSHAHISGRPFHHGLLSLPSSFASTNTRKQTATRRCPGIILKPRRKITLVAERSGITVVCSKKLAYKNSLSKAGTYYSTLTV